MNVNLLIDAIVRQTTVLIAQLATGWFSARERATAPCIAWRRAKISRMQSVVKTICCKLRRDQPPDAKDAVGGSTYTFVVWEGHPLEEEVLRGLARYRQQGDNLRERVDANNARHGVPKRHRKIIGYGGQCTIEEECEETDG